MTDRIEIKAALSVTDTGEITGTAWPFGSADRVGDIIEKGAITTPDTLPMLFGHDQQQVIGVWNEITESDTGLTVKGKLLVDDVERAREVRAMIRSKAVSGLSIGFVTTKSTRNAKGRNITALNLHEISVVAVPCHPGAQITSLKSDDTAPHKENPNMENEDLKNDEIEVKTPANDAPGADTKAFEEMKSRLAQLEAKAARPHGVHITGPVGGETEEKAFTGFLRTGDKTEVKALTVANSTGEILAPETVSKNILEKIAEFSPMRNISQVIQMNGPLLQLPRLVTEVAPAAVAEGGLKAESEPTFEQIDLKPHEMGVMVPVSQTLLEDSHIDLSSYLGNHIARRFGQLESTWLINGTGLNAPEGVLNSAEVATNEVMALTSDAIIDHFYDVKTAYSVNGSWLMNRNTMASVRKLKGADGQYIWQPSIAAGQPATLMGRPVYEAVDMPDAVAGSPFAIFGDFSVGYAIADRVNFTVIRDDITGAQSGIVKFIARRRVGGRVVMGEALSKLSLAP